MRPRLTAYALDAIGVVVSLLALWSTLAALRVGIDSYDEGIVLADANAMLHGAAPYRDFYSNYPPGIFLVVAGVWRVVGVGVVAERVVGLVIHVVIAALAGRLSGRVAGRRFSWLAAGLTLKWMIMYQLTAFAYLGAVAATLGSAEVFLWARRQPQRRWRWLSLGVALGVVSTLRHDVFVFVLLFSSAALVVAWRRKQLRLDRALARQLAWVALGLAVVGLTVWVPTLARAGVRQVVNDLYFDQVKYVLPARVLPFPPLFALTAIPSLPWLRLPAFLVAAWPASVVLVFITPLVALAVVLWRWRRPGGVDGAVVTLVGVISAALLPHTLGRSDVWHVSFALAPTFILLCGLCDRLARARAAGLVGAALVTLWIYQPGHEPLWPLKHPTRPPTSQTLGLAHVGVVADFDPVTRRAIVAFVRAHTRPGEPIFVGAGRHDQVMSSLVDLYFISDRPGATRYQQFDPNVVTRADVQRQMIAELERARPAVAVLSPALVWYEPNLSTQPGAHLLDDYLARHYTVEREVNTYRLLVRK